MLPDNYLPGEVKKNVSIKQPGRVQWQRTHQRSEGSGRSLGTPRGRISMGWVLYLGALARDPFAAGNSVAWKNTVIGVRGGTCQPLRGAQPTRPSVQRFLSRQRTVDIHVHLPPL